MEQTAHPPAHTPTAPVSQPEPQLGGRFWTHVRGETYGPYSLMAMARFLAEGRLTAATLVAVDPDAPFRPAREHPPLAQALAGLKAQFAARAPAHAADQRGANLYLFTDIRSGASADVPRALDQIGLWAEIAIGLYIVRTRQTAGQVRNALSQVMAKGDMFVVIDASRDRFAWFNVGPEADVAMRTVWNKELTDPAR